MRVLLATRGSSGHVGPLAPFGQACVRAGHEVLVVAQAQHRSNVERTGLPFAPVGDPPPEEWMPLLGEFARAPHEAAHARMVGEFFAGVDLRAALPGQRALVEEWRPDVIVRDSWEFASAVVAELHGIPLVRVGLGLAAMEELSIRHAAAGVDAARAGLGRPADPDGDRLREAPYLTVVPELLEDPATPASGPVARFAHGLGPAGPAEPWGDGDAPLVYVTFGSVTAGAHLPYYPGLHRAAIDALAPLHARILLTIGDDRDPAQLGTLPANVRAERWVSHGSVMPRAAVVVGHGGYGTTLDALGHGTPLVVVPLFSLDQWANADAVARVGAGVALVAERGARAVLETPGPATLDRLGPAVQELLDDPSYRRGAEAVATARRALPPVEAAVDQLVRLAGTRS